MKRIGIVGCGAIGTQIALAVRKKKINAVLAGVYDIDPSRAAKLLGKLKAHDELKRYL